ncbi:MAG: hypothetical protein KC729_19475, partial [Candidatus Eisenbacteria bacterium]|nr:hypothetical protein [Candidatus Eisenbacteria bacterium]
PYPMSLTSYEPRLVWKVTVETDGRTGVFEHYIDARTGEILWRHDAVHYVTYAGATEGMVEDKTWCNGQAMQRLKYEEVNVEGLGTITSNGNGDWSITGPDVGFRAVSTRFRGPFVDLNRTTGGTTPIIFDFCLPGKPCFLTWSDDNSRRDERDVFDAVVDIHDFFETLDPGYSYSNRQIRANVGVPGTCNAFWNGSINFYDASSSCANSGEIQGVVEHEFGHGVQDNLIGSQGNEGLGEGNADVLANFMTDDSLVGRGFFLSCSSGIRNSNNNRQYPEDLNGEEHNDGQIMSGVMWDTRTNLQSSLGTTAGKARAAMIWHFGRKLERPDTQPDQCLSMFIADDDNGNVLDGTPNFDALCAAVMKHDTDGDAFDCPEFGSVWVDFAATGTQNGTQAHPYHSVFQAQSAAVNGYVMKVRDGATTEIGTLSKPGELRAIGGIVRVGAP